MLSALYPAGLTNIHKISHIFYSNELDELSADTTINRDWFASIPKERPLIRAAGNYRFSAQAFSPNQPDIR